MATSKHTFKLFVSPSQGGVLAAASSNNDGSVTVELSKLQDVSDSKTTQTHFRAITTTTENCSFNVYASAEPPKVPQFSTQVQLVSTSSDSRTVRIGNQIFLPEPKHDASCQKPFSPKDFSLHLDHIEQHNRYLFVTSRQKVTTVPEAINASAKGAAEPEASNRIKNSNDDATSAQTGVGATNNSSTAAKPLPSTSDSSDEASSEPNSDPSTEDEGLSAYESWSEASTEYSEDEILPELQLRPAAASIDVQMAAERSKDATTDTSASDDDIADDASTTSTSSESGSEDAEPSATRHSATAMDEVEDERMFTAIYIDDRDAPASNSEEDNDDYPPDEVFEDTGYDMFGSDEDFDGFQAEESDSEECEECGDDGGGACALPSAPAAMVTQAKAEDEEQDTPLGMPTAQIHVYDTETQDEDGQPQRIFRYAAPIMGSPLLYNSHPAVHPTKPLLVYPLGDSKLLYADYIGNTYFTRKIRPSRMWSTHVSITPFFSKDRQHLHVAVVEKQGHPPLRPKKGKIDLAQARKERAAKKKEPSKYELVVLTYRLSRGKTSRAPPMLMHRELVDLGSSKGAPPSCMWSDDELLVSCIRDDGKLDVYNIRVSTTQPNAKSTRAKTALRTPAAAVRRLSLQLPVWTADRKVQYLPNARMEGRGPVILASASQHLKPVTVSKPDAQLTTSEPVTGQSPTGDVQANVESDQAKEPAAVANGLGTNDMERKEEKPDDEMTAVPAHPAIMVVFLTEADVIDAWFVDGEEEKGKAGELGDEAWWVGV